MGSIGAQLLWRQGKRKVDSSDIKCDLECAAAQAHDGCATDTMSADPFLQPRRHMLLRREPAPMAMSAQSIDRGVHDSYDNASLA